MARSPGPGESNEFPAGIFVGFRRDVAPSFGLDVDAEERADDDDEGGEEDHDDGAESSDAGDVGATLFALTLLEEVPSLVRDPGAELSGRETESFVRAFSGKSVVVLGEFEFRVPRLQRRVTGQIASLGGDLRETVGAGNAVNRSAMKERF